MLNLKIRLSSKNEVLIQKCCTYQICKKQLDPNIRIFFSHLSLHFFSLLVFISLAFSPNQSLAIQHQHTPEESRQFLLGLPLIRVGFKNSPNLGHQSAAGALVQHIRELGYTGQIELIYDKEARDKLGVIFSNFDPMGPQIQNDFTQKISFIQSSKANLDRLAFTDLGFMGGDDTSTSAETFKVRYLIAVQPFRWIINPTVTPARLGPYPFPEWRDSGIPYTPAKKESLQEQLQNTLLSSSAYSGKAALLMKILEISQQARISSVYGFGILKDPAKLLTYLSGIVQFQKMKDKSLHKLNRDIILVFNSGSIQEIWARAKSEYQESDAEEFLEQMDWIDLMDPDLESKISNSQSIKTLVIGVGHVPRGVFEGFFDLSFFPPIVEGLNSIYLMRILGKPFIPSSAAENFGFKSQPFRVDLKDILSRVRHSIPSSRINTVKLQGYWLSQFFHHTVYENSLLRHFFHSQKIETANFQNDKVLGLVGEMLDFKSRMQERALPLREQIYKTCERLLSPFDLKR